MKFFATISLVIFSFATCAQVERINPHSFDLTKSGEQKSIVNDTTFDVKHYHLDLQIAIDSPFIGGNVSSLVLVKTDGLNALKLDLDNAFIIDSTSSNIDSYALNNNILYIQFVNTYTTGDFIEFVIYYHGIPPLAGGFKGLRYETHDSGEPIIASLSTPYLAHTWWPCKDGTTDKADSTFIDITIKDTVISSFPVIALSNGVLETVSNSPGYKTFQWRHRYPIVPYYVMVAISNYTTFQQIFNGPGYSFPMDYYVFESHIADAQMGVQELPAVMQYFTDIFGPYPFPDERYAMTQLGYYGGIENQTNSIVNNMGSSWFNVSVHELAHQWFADMITCEDWHHGWLNEGFASYAEALYNEFDNGFLAYQNYMVNFEYYNGGTLYRPDVSNPFSVFQSILYDKGAYTLHMLRGVMGDPHFFNALYTYANSATHQYKHATTEEFQAVCENISGLDLSTFFDQWIYDEYYPKYRYNYISDNASGDISLTILQSQSSQNWRSLFEMPMDIRFEFSDGSDSTITVQNDAIAQTFQFNFSKIISNVLLDPDHWVLKNVTFDPTLQIGITEFQKNEAINIYPNPGNGIIHIEFQKTNGNPINFSLYDVSGKIQNATVLQVSKNIYHLESNGLSSGTYVLEINTISGSIFRRIQIQ